MKEPREFGLSFGDLGVIAIALVFALSGLYLMVGPSPFGNYFSQKKPEPTEISIDVSNYKEANKPPVP